MKKGRKAAGIAALVLATLLLAAGAVSLHMTRAVSPQGTVFVSEYALEDGGSDGYGPALDDPWADQGLIHIRGTLPVGYEEGDAATVRVALIPEAIAEGEAVKAQDEAILLRTQFERRETIGEDGALAERCGFYAAVRRDALKGQGWQYRVALTDTAGGGKRMIKTNMRIVAIDGGLAYGRANPPAEVDGDTVKND